MTFAIPVQRSNQLSYQANWELACNVYPYEENPVKYLFVTEKYLPASGREKFVHETNFIVRWQ